MLCLGVGHAIDKSGAPDDDDNDHDDDGDVDVDDKRDVDDDRTCRQSAVFLRRQDVDENDCFEQAAPAWLEFLLRMISSPRKPTFGKRRLLEVS